MLEQEGQQLSVVEQLILLEFILKEFQLRLKNPALSENDVYEKGNFANVDDALVEVE